MNRPKRTLFLAISGLAFAAGCNQTTIYRSSNEHTEQVTGSQVIESGDTYQPSRSRGPREGDRRKVTETTTKRVTDEKIGDP